METWTDEQRYTAAWQALKGLGSRRIRRLVDYFGSARAAWTAPADEVIRVAALGSKLGATVDAARRRFDWDRQEADLKRYGARLVTWRDEEYPYLLKETCNAPAVLFYQGTLAETDKRVAIVGSRKASPYGLNVSRHVAETLARNGVTIVSGGARGIDTKAHKGALHVQGQTLVVIASGLGRTYPPENKRLFAEICERGGAIVTEFAFGSEPVAQNFPARNRIIAGLSRSVIVVEAALRSGSLITADFALEEGRDVFAVPGSIFSTQSQGTNHLIRMGAAILTEAADVLDEYGWESEEAGQKTNAAAALTDAGKAVWEALSESEARPLDELVVRTKLSAADVQVSLLQLTLHNLAEETIPGLYLRCPG